ncbi:MAG: FAD-dependent oxidoreductase [bacterium]|nr:FAD-dependent oxidoreductase [bacterium]
MNLQVELRISPEEATDDNTCRNLLACQLEVPESNITFFTLLRRSLDARQRKVVVNLLFDVWLDEEPQSLNKEDHQLKLQNVSSAPEVIVIGAGPAGLFAALRLIELGYRPIILERGRSVRERRHDIATIMRHRLVNENSNYCFGEGGAGTFSDGKLFTRSHKRGSTQRILNILVANGADKNILIDAHPHIGTNRLPGIIEQMRESIIACGGEVRFSSRVTEFDKDATGITSVRTDKGELFKAKAIILATGHSARDIFSLLNNIGLQIELKPFALGLRIEHPQPLIDKLQYKQLKGSPYLPAASYSLKAQTKGRGVFSFCMCPGGIICPAATAPGEVVVNGWSPSRRNSPFANSGIVTEVDCDDFAPWKEKGELAGVHFQQHIERRAFSAAGSSLSAPGLRLTDLLANKISNSLPECSYHPGITPVSFSEFLPAAVLQRLKDGLKQFGNKLPGYITNEAIVVGVESRTSSPIRIPRDKNTLCHPQAAGLFPCGEGAGYAGGILSAAMDGERCAAAVDAYMQGK